MRDDHPTRPAPRQSRRPAGFTLYAERDRRRVFFHTEVADEFERRGLATILVGEPLTATKDAGLRIVPMCELTWANVDKHQQSGDVADTSQYIAAAPTS